MADSRFLFNDLLIVPFAAVYGSTLREVRNGAKVRRLMQASSERLQARLKI